MLIYPCQRIGKYSQEKKGKKERKKESMNRKWACNGWMIPPKLYQ
jgi:hypothetical protein